MGMVEILFFCCVTQAAMRVLDDGSKLDDEQLSS